MDSFHQHCWRTDPLPDNTSSPCDGGRDGALNAALSSALLSRSQGTAGSEKPDISQPIRFSRVFFFPTKKKKKLHLLLLFFFCSLCEQRRFACTLSVQFSYKNTICRVEVIQISSQIRKIKVMIFFLFVVPVWWKAIFVRIYVASYFTWHLNTCKIV